MIDEWVGLCVPHMSEDCCLEGVNVCGLVAFSLLECDGDLCSAHAVCGLVAFSLGLTQSEDLCSAHTEYLTLPWH